MFILHKLALETKDFAEVENANKLLQSKARMDAWVKCTNLKNLKNEKQQRESLRKQQMEQEKNDFEEAEAAAKEATDAELKGLKALTTITTRTHEEDFLDETESPDTADTADTESDSSISDTGIIGTIPEKVYKVVYNEDPDLMKLGGVIFGHEFPTSTKITAEAAKKKEDEMNAEHAAKKSRNDAEAKRRADTLAPAEITNPKPTVETEEILRSSLTGTPSDESSRMIIVMDLEGVEHGA